MDRYFNKTIRHLRGNLLLTMIILIIVSSILVAVNYYTIKINSSIRAYIHGESMYSKGQKDAARYLTEFVYTNDSVNISLFKKSIAIPKSDGLARLALENKDDYLIIANHLRNGNNHIEDIDNLIWLFNNFINISFMQKAYFSWHQADTLIIKLDLLGDSIFSLMHAMEPSPASKKPLLEQIGTLNDQLTAQQLEFSDTLSEAGRKAETYLFYFNLTVIIMILSITSLSLFGLVKRLVLQNASLKIINKELDRFVYSASHDLRAPISSLKGLINLVNAEKNPREMKNYINMMMKILERQDSFLKDIINFSKNKRLNSTNALINSNTLIDQVITNHQFMDGAENIKFTKSIQLEEFVGDEPRLLIIINNLVSNAVKYHDESKKTQYITIILSKQNDRVVLKIKDNGLGIDANYKERIFDMFFVTDNKNRGSGLGLYIVANALESIDGTISVDSEVGKGSVFTIKFPYKGVVLMKKPASS